MELVESVSESVAPAVHQDTLKTPLTNPVTGFTTDSTSAYMENCKANNLEVVGNDRVGKTPRRPGDTVNESRYLDAIHKAEAIASDPARLRAERNRQVAMYEQRRRLLHGR